MELVKLVSASDAECSMMAEVLKKEGINHEIHDENANAYFRAYGAAPLVGEKNIFVDQSDVVRAQELLGLGDGFEKMEKRKIPAGIRIIAILFLLSLFFVIVIRIVASMHGSF